MILASSPYESNSSQSLALRPLIDRVRASNVALLQSRAAESSSTAASAALSLESLRRDVIFHTLSLLDCDARLEQQSSSTTGESLAQLVARAAMRTRERTIALRAAASGADIAGAAMCGARGAGNGSAVAIARAHFLDAVRRDAPSQMAARGPDPFDVPTAAAEQPPLPQINHPTLTARNVARARLAESRALFTMWRGLQRPLPSVVARDADPMQA
jgi:hypothetical protein